MVIFDCNGVLVDSEPIATAVAAEEFARVGIPLTPDIIARYFTGRRSADMLAAVEAATHRRLPLNFANQLTAAMLRRFRKELRPTPHIAYALTWLRGPKCVASSSTHDRIRVSLETTGLLRFFGNSIFSASEVRYGKPAPDLLQHAAARMGVQASDCIVIEDSTAGISAARAAGMMPIGYVGNAQDDSGGRNLMAAGAHTLITDMRQLKSTVVALRGW